MALLTLLVEIPPSSFLVSISLLSFLVLLCPLNKSNYNLVSSSLTGTDTNTVLIEIVVPLAFGDVDLPGAGVIIDIRNGTFIPQFPTCVHTTLTSFAFGLFVCRNFTFTLA